MSDRTGAEMIAAERQRQIEREGWTAEHDDEHEWGELARAGACYADHTAAMLEGQETDDPHPFWPWRTEDWKPTSDPIRDLVKAGALLAAEIDRLSRAS